MARFPTFPSVISLGSLVVAVLVAACGSSSATGSPKTDAGAGSSAGAGATAQGAGATGPNDAGGTTPTGTADGGSGSRGEAGTPSDAGPPAAGAITATTGTVWYVRLDGGTAAQCDGQGDAPYTGDDAGPPQHCAFRNPYYLWGDDVTYGETPAWKIAGGDSVIFEGGPFRMGFKGPDSGDYWQQCPGDPYGCTMPTIPAGTAGKTTKLLGEKFASCSAKTQLFGGYGLGTVLNLAGAKFVDVACLELTDHSACDRIAGNCSTSYPLDDYSTNGIVTDLGTSDVGLYDLDIHGFVSRAIIGPLGGKVTVNNVRGAFNTGAGWDFDDGAGTMSAAGAAVAATGLTIEWNGCTEEYPITDPYPAKVCYDQDNGGYGDGIGTPDTALDFSCDHCSFNHNTQDGLDLLHTSGSAISVTHSRSYANMGQQWKMGTMQSVVFQNNETFHNCNRMSAAIDGAPASYNQGLSLFCRAAGDGFAFSLKNGGTYTYQNNTFVGYGATTYDVSCAGSDCSSASFVYENNIDVGLPNPLNGGELPGHFYFGNSVTFSKRDHNIVYGFHNDSCPTSYPSETCASPLLVNQPVFAGEASLDALDFRLAAGSPAVDTGVALPAITDDYAGTARPQGAGYDIGAIEQ